MTILIIFANTMSLVRVFESVDDAIGDTRLFRLRRTGAGSATPICAEAAFVGIGGGIRDRAAQAMIEQGERDLELEDRRCRDLAGPRRRRGRPVRRRARPHRRATLI